MYDALIWLLAIEALGLLAFPLAFRLLSRLPDRGFSLAKPLGILLPAYIFWLLGLTQVIPTSRYTIIGILVALALVSAFLLRSKLGEIRSFVLKNPVPLVVGELVFLGFYFLWVSVVSYAPAINHTEQPMDFAFLNSILKSDHFPPEDPWLAGHSISYYYFGHFMMAFVTKLTAIPSSISYNLSIALIPALTGLGAFGLVFNLIRLSGARAWVAGLFALAAPLFIVLIGNLEGVLEFVQVRGWGSDGFWEWISIKGLDGQGAETRLIPNDHWWWWRASRIVDSGDAITEFPFFSFFLADLHAHVMALPFLIFNLGLGLNLLLSSERIGFAWLRRNWWEALAIALVLGSLAFINMWDFPVFAVAFAAVVLVKSYGDWGGRALHAALHSLAVALPVLAVAVVLYMPFHLTWSSQASGISTLGESSTRPLFFFLIWGLFLVLSGSFLLRQLWTVPGWAERNPAPLAIVVVVTLLPFLLWAGWKLMVSPFDGGIGDGLTQVATRLGKLLPAMAIIVVALYSMLLRVKHGKDRSTIYPLLLLALAFYLLVGVELFRVVDFFGNRMNTVFKAYYQAWVLLAVVSAYGLYYWCSRPLPALGRPWLPARLPLGVIGRAVRYGWIGIVAVLVLASVYYSLGAALDRSEGSGGTTLDGLAFLQKHRSGEYEAIEWLRDQAPRGRIVEAVGGGYSEFGRISASTGLPTVLGWEGHEHQWRGTLRHSRGRKDQVEQIYTSGDPGLVQELLDRYDIRYVYVGNRERREYGEGHLNTFSDFLRPAFDGQSVVIYERANGRPIVTDKDNGDTG